MKIQIVKTNQEHFELSTTMFQEALKLLKKTKNSNKSTVFENLKKVLGHVYCQDDNIRQLSKSFRRWYLLRKKEKPLSFFLVGTSGVGKTYTTKKMAEALSSEGYSWYYEDMNGYMEKHNVSNLVGSPRGYVGSTDKPKIFIELDNSKDGKLVICFDEIEKAHPDVLTRLMQLLEMGHLNWSGGEGDFSNCIIFFTSNAIMDALVKTKKEHIRSGGNSKDLELQEKITSLLVRSNVIRTEVSGRIDRFLVYNPLEGAAILEIIYQRIIDSCSLYDIVCAGMTPEVLVHIALKSEGSTKGARIIDKFVKELIDDLLEFKDDNDSVQRIVISINDFKYFFTDSNEEVHLNKVELFKKANELLVKSKGKKTKDSIGKEKNKPEKEDQTLREKANIKIPSTHPKSNPVFPKDIESYFAGAVGMIKSSKGSGTGFAISPDGHILTCSHVVNNAEKIHVKFNGSDKEWPATILNLHKKPDIALLKIDVNSPINYFNLMESSNSVKLGGQIGLLAFPMGEDWSDSVSYYEGTVNNNNLKKRGCKFLQINNEATHGSSGGPVFNLSDGKVVGILTGGVDASKASGFNVASGIENVFELLSFEKELKEEGTLSISSGEKGIRFKDVFGSYLNGVENIILEEPYLTNSEQRNNFIEFTWLLDARNGNRTFKIITKAKHYSIKERKEIDYSGFLTDNFFKITAEKLAEKGVGFDYKFKQDVHDREINLSNGWVIKMGRGLHIYERYMSDDLLRKDQSLRSCKSCKVTYLKSK